MRGRIRPRAGRSAVVLAGALIVVAALGTTPALATAKKTKPLSLTSVAFGAGVSPVSEPLYVGIGAGLFQKYGLNVTWTNLPGGASQILTTLLAGGVQFAVPGANAAVQAYQTGAPIRAIGQIGVGGPQQLAISAAAATAHNIPTANHTPAQVLKQLQALKGSHLQLATSGLTANSYIWFAAAARKYGLTLSTTGDKSADIDIITTGSVPTEVTAFLAGKVDGFLNIPPATEMQPNSVVVPYAVLKPLTTTTALYTVTTNSMIADHPDVVQAIMNGLTAAVTTYWHHHPANTEAIVNNIIQQNSPGVTAGELDQAYKLNEMWWGNPYPTRGQYNQSLAVYDIIVPTPFTVTYNQFFDLKFVRNAEKLLDVAIPKG